MFISVRLLGSPRLLHSIVTSIYNRSDALVVFFFIRVCRTTRSHCVFFEYVETIAAIRDVIKIRLGATSWSVVGKIKKKEFLELKNCLLFLYFKILRIFLYFFLLKD